MARDAVFKRDTKLWHPEVGWQVFPQGEQNPGPAWSEIEGGAPSDVSTPASALKELAAATDRAEKAERRVAAMQADLDARAQGEADANAKVAGLERRAGEAEKALAEAQADKDRYAQERDQAREAEASARRDQAAARDRVTELETDIANANQRAADAEAALAAFDKDGDGKAGGSKTKKAAAADPGAETASGDA